MKKILLLTVLLSVTGGLSARAQILVDVQFGGNAYGSFEADQQTGPGQAGGSAGDQWDDIAWSSDVSGPYTTELLNPSGGDSDISLTIAPHGLVLSEYATSSSLPSTSLADLYEGFLDADTGTYTNGGGNVSSTFTFSGLTAGQSYDLYIYSAPNRDRESDWSLNGATPVQVGFNNSATDLESPNNYIVLNGVANSSNELVLEATSVDGYEIDVNGFQLAAVSAPRAVHLRDDDGWSGDLGGDPS